MQKHEGWVGFGEDHFPEVEYCILILDCSCISQPTCWKTQSCDCKIFCPLGTPVVSKAADLTFISAGNWKECHCLLNNETSCSALDSASAHPIPLEITQSWRCCLTPFSFLAKSQWWIIMLECCQIPSGNNIFTFDNWKGLSPNPKIPFDEEHLSAKLEYLRSKTMPDLARNGNRRV